MNRRGAIDWSQIICDLEAAGMTQRAIGDACETSASWANNLKNIEGTEPKFHNGALLLGLWSQKLGRPANAVPREAAFVQELKHG